MHASTGTLNDEDFMTARADSDSDPEDQLLNSTLNVTDQNIQQKLSQ